ncbi:MAG: hypothetical protein ACREBG_17315 [Pyrinomonadaceae bacterium]
MKSILPRTPQTFFLPILIFTASVTLATLGVVMPLAHGSGQQGKERSVQIKIDKDPPAEIVAVKIKGASVEIGQKFVGDADWFTGMVVTIKNVSNRPIVYATVLVATREEKNGVRTQFNGRDVYDIIELTYGEPPPMPGKLPRPNTDPPLMPGQTTDLILNEKWRDEFYSRLRHQDASTDLGELTLSVYQVAFLGDNDTMWMHGFWCRRDAKDPGTWHTIDDLPRFNHAPVKASFLPAPKLNSHLRGRPFGLPVTLPPCAHRDIGDVATKCATSIRWLYSYQE